jgi:hypothetical protein
MKRVSGPMRVVIAICTVAIIGIVLAAPLLWRFFTHVQFITNLTSGP